MSKKINKKKSNKAQTDEEIININKMDPPTDTSKELADIYPEFTKSKHARDKPDEFEIVKTKLGRKTKKTKKGMINLDNEGGFDLNAEFINFKSEENNEGGNNIMGNFPPSHNLLSNSTPGKFLPFASSSRAGLSLGVGSSELFNRHFPPSFKGKPIIRIFGICNSIINSIKIKILTIKINNFRHGRLEKFFSFRTITLCQRQADRVYQESLGEFEKRRRDVSAQLPL